MRYITCFDYHGGSPVSVYLDKYVTLCIDDELLFDETEYVMVEKIHKVIHMLSNLNNLVFIVTTPFL